MDTLKETPSLSQDGAAETLSAVLLTTTSSSSLSFATVGNAAASGDSGMFKKRAKTTSAQKGLRKPVTSASSSTPRINISDDDSEDEESDDGENFKSSDVFAGRKRKRGFIQGVSSRKPTTSKEDLGVSYDANKSSEAFLDPKTQATAISAEFNDAELLGRTKSTTIVESTSDNLYRGQKGYRTLVAKREQITTKYNSMGPQRAASNVRMTTVTDYAPGLSFSLNLLTV
jgi:hypothetical protein